MFVDLKCRVAFMKDLVNQELVTLSAMVGYEAVPLHFIHFPKLWLEVYNTPVSVNFRFQFVNEIQIYFLLCLLILLM